MPRRIIAVAPLGQPRRSLTATGDSLTHNVTLGVRPDEFWPERLAVALRALGVSVRARNFGKSGNTSTQIVARKGQLLRYDVPLIGAIWAGANDPGNAIPGATTQANIQDLAETMFAAGTTYIVIGNTQYLNYPTGGDTTTTQTSAYATLKTFQLAAKNALATAHPGKVAYCDTYAAMRQRIVDGIDVQGSGSWHVAAAGNQHLNAYGEQIVADAMLAAIQAQAGWLTALKGA